jgi:hypothetical protein
MTVCGRHFVAPGVGPVRRWHVAKASCGFWGNYMHEGKNFAMRFNQDAWSNFITAKIVRTRMTTSAHMDQFRT